MPEAVVDRTREKLLGDFARSTEADGLDAFAGVVAAQRSALVVAAAAVEAIVLGCAAEDIVTAVSVDLVGTDQ